MPSFLLIVFLVQLGIHLVNTIGADTFSEWLWVAYNKLPTPHSSAYKEANRLRRQAMRLKHDLNATSAQDEFAKWAKLQRQYDKSKAAYDKKANDLKSFETRFKSVASVIRWLATNGLRFFLQWWYGKVPMFWLPNGWVPGYVEWVLAFPKAPSGSISIQMWFAACGSVIIIAGEGLAALWALVLLRNTPAAKEELLKEKVAADSEKTGKKDL